MTKKMLNNWNDEQFKVMDKAILKHFKNKTVRTHHGNHFITSYKQLDSIFGLAYTSTGKWAEYGVCNTNVYFDIENKYRYEGFIMDENSNCFAYLYDKDENEIIIPL